MKIKQNHDFKIKKVIKLEKLKLNKTKKFRSTKIKHKINIK